MDTDDDIPIGGFNLTIIYQKLIRKSRSKRGKVRLRECGVYRVFKNFILNLDFVMALLIDLNQLLNISNSYVPEVLAFGFDYYPHSKDH